MHGVAWILLDALSMSISQHRFAGLCGYAQIAPGVNSSMVGVDHAWLSPCTAPPVAVSVTIAKTAHDRISFACRILAIVSQNVMRGRSAPKWVVHPSKE